MRSLALFVPVLVLAGCPDPEKQYPDGTPTTPAVGDPAAAGAGTTAPPPPGDAGAGGGAPSVPTLTVEPGTGVKLSGTFTYEGSTKGAYRIDIFRLGADGRPMILHAGTLEKTGDWELEVPKDLGTVTIMAFVDSNGNGPEVAEPSMTLSDVSIADQPVTGLALKPADGAKNDYAVDSPNLPPPGAAMPSQPGGPVGEGGAAAPPADGAAAGTPPGAAPAAGAPPADGAAAPAGGAAAPAAAATK